jgi:hypothetical protein
MTARVDEELGDGVLAVCNGMKFKVNDLVSTLASTKCILITVLHIK